MMEIRDIVFSIVMVVSSFVLTYEWLGRFSYDPANSLIILAAIVMVGALAAMILSVDIRLRKLETTIDIKERSLKTNVQSIESYMDRKMNEVISRVNETLEALDSKRYR
jgi:Co/Zn/Cd efflux system component